MPLIVFGNRQAVTREKKKKNPRSILRGRGEDESQCAVQNHLFSTAEVPGAPRSCICTPYNAPPPTLGRRWPQDKDVRTSLGPGKDGSEEECLNPRAFPSPPEPPPGRKVSAEDRPEEVRGRGLPESGPHPGSGAVSSPRLSPAGGLTLARAGRRDRPQEGRVSHCTPWTRLEFDPACPGRIRDEKERLSLDAVAFPGTSPQGRSLRSFPGTWRAAAALGTSQGPPGTREEGR
ncbi:uncharacterized protein LOC122204551 [Panthera leo]|uniref:uncharacterized protein LOC122204551 n=1 Tax=Panthera leo TaxID=9689 RepID=UPI001C6A73A0|nr:uncharacterized protein LOC122204551 [Panthera leo]